MLVDSKSADVNTKPSTASSRTPVLPGTQSKTAATVQPLPPDAVTSIHGGTASIEPLSDTDVPPETVPKITESPPGTAAESPKGAAILPTASSGELCSIYLLPLAWLRTDRASATSNTPPPSPSPPAPALKKKPRRFRRFVLAVFLISGLGFGGGTYYSLVSDNFHDFFTEYIPFGEDAVLYFEEREYRKRFPNITNPTSRPKAEQGNTITIPSKSGVSWKVAGEEHQASDQSTKAKPSREAGKSAQKDPSGSTAQEKIAAVEVAKKDASAPSIPPAPRTKESKPPPAPAAPLTPPVLATKGSASKPVEPPQPPRATKDDATRPPEVNEPSKFMPITPIDPLKIKNAEEPLVQDLVKILNDIITVVNNDAASYKYSSTIDKAKQSLAKVGARIMGLKETATKEAKEWRTAQETEFDQKAIELLQRVESDMQQQQIVYREEFEQEREKLSQSYQARLQVETQRLQEVAEQRTRNQLLEQSIALKKQFVAQVTERVESERNGRLGQLSDLSNSITELEKLTAEWSGVLDANLRTQHMQVAVEAVRSLLETANRPRPFVKELAALKEVAADDAVISAAIASINPTAYQRGIPTTAQLIDRFRRVAAEVRKAALLPEDAGVASHAASWALSNVLFKKKGLAVGDDVESVLTRTETLLEEGNLDDAAREMNGLNGWAKALSDDWLSECRRVLEVRQALDVMATQARLEGLKVDA